MCGACCKGFNEGDVYVYKEDIERLLQFFHIKNRKSKLKKFTKKYLKIVETYFKLKGKYYKIQLLGFKFIGDDQHCEFLDLNNSCTVHEARPFQCRAFPIGWNMLVENFENFIDYSQKCHGLKDSLKNKGSLYSKQEVLKWARIEYEMERKYYLEMKKNNFDIFKVYKFLPKKLRH